MKLISKIKNTTSFSKGLVLVDQIMVSGCNFLLGIILVRAIGLEEYGLFALIWMCVLFALGINQAFITKPLLSIAPKLKNKEQNDYLAGLHAIQYLLNGVFFGIAFLLYAGAKLFFANEFTSYIPLISIIIFCQTVHDFYRKTYLIKDRIFKVLLLDVVLYLGQIIGVFTLLFFGKLTLTTALFVILAANLLSVLFGKYSLTFSLLNYKKILIRHFHFSKWLLGTSVLQWLSGNYFIIVGASILGTSAVGAIRMVQNVMGLCHILFLAMESIIPIEAARQYQAEGESSLIQYLIKITKKSGLGFSLMLLVIGLFAGPILTLIYGATAANHAYIVVAYTLLYFLVFIGHPFRFYLRTIEQTSPIFYAYCFGALFSLSCAYPLLDHLGMYGLLFGLIFTQLINILTYYFFSIKTKNFSVQKIK